MDSVAGLSGLDMAWPVLLNSMAWTWTTTWPVGLNSLPWTLPGLASIAELLGLDQDIDLASVAELPGLDLVWPVFLNSMAWTWT